MTEGIKDYIKDLEEKNKELEKELLEANDEIDDLETQISDLEGQVEDLERTVNNLEDYEDEASELKEKLENSFEHDGSLEMQYKIEAFKENQHRFSSAEFEKLMKNYKR